MAGKKDDGFGFINMPPNYLGRYNDVVLEEFPALKQLLEQLPELPKALRQHFADYIAKFGMQLAHPGKFPALEQVMLRLLQLPPKEQEAWGHMLMALMAGLMVKEEE
jgi:hypothetical protein